MKRLTEWVVSTSGISRKIKQSGTYLSRRYFGSHEGAGKYDPHGSSRFRPCEPSVRARTASLGDEDPRRIRAKRNEIATNVSLTSISTPSKTARHPGAIRRGHFHVYQPHLA